MRNVIVKIVYDESDCETCGFIGSQGYLITIDGEEYDDLLPIATCTSSADYNDGDLLKFIAEKLGFSVQFQYEDNY